MPVRDRYCPDPETGWEKYWLSANGEDLYRLVKRGILSPSTCILQTGLAWKIRRPYLEILKRVRAQPGGNPHALAAYVMQLLAEIVDAGAQAARWQGKGDKQQPTLPQEDPVVGRVLGHI